LCRAGDRFNRALRWLEQAEAVAPGREEAPMAAGVLCQEMGLPADAIAVRQARCNGIRVIRLLSNRLFTMNYLLEWDAAGWLPNITDEQASGCRTACNRRRSAKRICDAGSAMFPAICAVMPWRVFCCRYCWHDHARFQ
jgi:hypothetical protein